MVPELKMQMPEKRRMFIETPPKFAGELADTSFRKPGPVDMILGAGLMALVIEDESILHGAIRWQKSLLGWLVYGGEQISAFGDVVMNVVQEKEKLEEWCQQ